MAVVLVAVAHLMVVVVVVLVALVVMGVGWLVVFAASCQAKTLNGRSPSGSRGRPSGRPSCNTSSGLLWRSEHRSL